MKSGIMYLLLVLLMLGAERAFANGGPIDVSSSVGINVRLILKTVPIMLIGRGGV